MFSIHSAFFLLPWLLVNLSQAIIKIDLGHFLVKQNICDLLIFSQEGEIWFPEVSFLSITLWFRFVSYFNYLF